MTKKYDISGIEVFIGNEIARMKEIKAIIESDKEMPKKETKKLENEYNQLGKAILNFILTGEK